MVEVTRQEHPRCPECNGCPPNHKFECPAWCKPANKHRFKTEHEALVALTEAKIAQWRKPGRTKRREQRAYLCREHCQGWHLTSRRNPPLRVTVDESVRRQTAREIDTDGKTPSSTDTR